MFWRLNHSFCWAKVGNNCKGYIIFTHLKLKVLKTHNLLENAICECFLCLHSNPTLLHKLHSFISNNCVDAFCIINSVHLNQIWQETNRTWIIWRDGKLLLSHQRKLRTIHANWSSRCENNGFPMQRARRFIICNVHSGCRQSRKCK